MPSTGHFFMPGIRSIMTFEGLFHLLEHGRHEKKSDPVPEPDITDPDITSEGGMKLPKISGGVPVG